MKKTKQMTIQGVRGEESWKANPWVLAYDFRRVS
jgi:hypothetical protein